MKYIINLILILTLSFAVNSTYADDNKTKVEVVQNGNCFSINKQSNKEYTKTKYTFKDSKGKEYPIYLTAKGRAFVFKVSKKTNKEYRYYLPKEIEEKVK